MEYTDAPLAGFNFGYKRLRFPEFPRGGMLIKAGAHAGIPQPLRQITKLF